MKKITVLSLIAAFASTFSLGQTLKINKVYSFNNKIVYTGTENSGKTIVTYSIYWNENDKDRFAFETMDKEGNSSGIMIFDNHEHYQYLIDKRELSGIRFTLSAVDPQLNAMNLKPVGSPTFFLGMKAQHYEATQPGGDKYEFWFAQNSPAMDSIFAFINALGIKFIQYPKGQKNVVLQYKYYKNGNLNVAFQATQAFFNQKFSFDLSQYKIQVR